MKLFLYDYANYDTDSASSIILFGYNEERQKCELNMTGFDVACDIVPDMEFFDTPQAFKDTIRGLNINTRDGSDITKVTKQPAKTILK
jgi:hypothetical protein